MCKSCKSALELLCMTGRKLTQVAELTYATYFVSQACCTQITCDSSKLKLYNVNLPLDGTAQKEYCD